MPNTILCCDILVRYRDGHCRQYRTRYRVEATELVFNDAIETESLSENLTLVAPKAQSHADSVKKKEHKMPLAS